MTEAREYNISRINRFTRQVRQKHLNGQRFGKRWKHAVRNAQQYLNGQGKLRSKVKTGSSSTLRRDDRF
jgi:hypothetical protein